MYEAAFGLVFALPYLVHPKSPIQGFALGFSFTAAIAIGVLMARHGRAAWYLWATLLIAGVTYALQILK